MFDAVKSDGTGVGYAGLKTAVAESAYKAILDEKTPRKGIPELRRRLISALEDVGEFSDDEIARVDTIIGMVQKERDFITSRAKGVTSPTSTNTGAAKALMVRALRIVGLRTVAPAVGGDSGSASLAIASQVSKSIGDAANALIGGGANPEAIQEILNRAVFDKDLMSALLKTEANLTRKDRNILTRALAATTRLVTKSAVGTVDPTIAGGTNPTQTQALQDFQEDEDGN